MLKNIQIERMLLSTLVLAIGIILTLSPTIVSGQEEATSEAKGNSSKVKERVNERKQEAQQKIDDKRSQREEKTAEKTQAACERRLSKITSTMERLSSKADNLQGVIDSKYAKVQDFVTNKQLNDPDYDNLNAAVAEAQAASLVEIAALSELNVEIDCTDPEVTVSVSAFKDSASAAKESLRTYRQALVSLISSLRAAVADENNGDNSSDSENSDSSDEADEDDSSNETDEDANNPESEEVIEEESTNTTSEQE